MIKTAVIIGAGPAGLTAAYELLSKTDIIPIIIERSNDIGGISKTVVHNGNRIDIGGHRFFSKSTKVMKWWQEILPLQGVKTDEEQINKALDPEYTDKIMLIRNRKSRIYFLKSFFDYPISINRNTISKLGVIRILKIIRAYLWIKVFPIKKINSLEDFFISRFGSELYETFFKEYTEKVWGVPCSDINAEWGSQRIKKLSISRALIHALKSILKKDKTIEQKKIETSLIDQFLYPKFGPGQMWETVAQLIEEKGGIIIKNCCVSEIKSNDNQIKEIVYIDQSTQKKTELKGDYFFSTMPVKELIKAMGKNVPENIKVISDGLQYRDFITVGLLLNKLKITNETAIKTINDLITDNWLYIQENGVKIGRIQIFNNWSPYMVADKNKVWIGVEYFCNEGDELWDKKDVEFINFAINELSLIDIIDKNDVIDSTIIRMLKAYPAYFGTYSQFNLISNYTDNFHNLFLIGRNGMHKYNNQDHSMLTAMTSVENIISGKQSKTNIWEINTEEEYNEK